MTPSVRQITILAPSIARYGKPKDRGVPTVEPIPRHKGSQGLAVSMSTSELHPYKRALLGKGCGGITNNNNNNNILALFQAGE